MYAALRSTRPHGKQVAWVGGDLGRSKRVPATLSAERCRICESSNIGITHKLLADDQFNLLRCFDCGAEFLDPQPSSEETQALYGPQYYEAWNMSAGENSAVRAIKLDTFSRCIRDLKKFVQTGNLLDVGTATGFLLESPRSHGFEAYGVEPSEYAGRITASKFGKERIHIGTLESAPFPPAMFDAVVMTDLLEHVPNPLLTLRCAYSLL